MSTTVEKISSNKVKLSFDIDAAKFDEAMGKAYIKVRGQVAIPGFRKGHAPRKMIENMYGEGSRSSIVRRSISSRSAPARTCSSPAKCSSSRT